MQFTYEGVTYKGVFVEQYQECDEANKVMTFTAVGDNNTCIWGSAGQATDAESPSIYVQDLEDGNYTFKSYNSNLLLNVSDGNINQWEAGDEEAQTFQIVTDDEGYSALLTASSNYTKAITVENGSSENGANIIEEEYTGDDSQKFIITSNGDGTYAILSKVSNGGAGLDVYAFSLENGGNVNQWSYWGGTCQKWIPTQVD